jgi:hypothetical protein
MASTLEDFKTRTAALQQTLEGFVLSPTTTWCVP